MRQQSIIDLIGWGLFVLIIYFVISALYGCGTVKPTQPVFDDWAAIPKCAYAPLISYDNEMIEWHGYLIVDVGDSLVVLKNQ